jgi:hypothetical protein
MIEQYNPQDLPQFPGGDDMRSGDGSARRDEPMLDSSLA